MTQKKLAILSSHPIQYNVPLFRMLAERGIIAVKVFYSWGKSVLQDKFDPGFGKVIKWDIPLLEGYEYEFLENTSRDPGSHHFRGIINPGIIPAIDAWRPDAILVYGWNFVSHLKAIRHYSTKIPVFFRGDSTLLNDTPGIRSLLRRTLLRWVYKHIDKAFYVGSNNKDYFLGAGMKEQQLVFAPHAVNNEFFRDMNGVFESGALSWRHELGIGDDRIVAVYAGKLETVKSLDTLIQVWTEPSFPDGIHLIMVGNGHLEGSLKKAAASNENIHFVDFQNQQRMPVVYRLGDVFILPSISETWGLSINEAMICGRPVIASSKCGATPDLIVEGSTGYVFAAGDSSDLRNKIITIAADKCKLKEMGKNAEIHIQRFTLSRVAEELEKALLVGK
jgi:glycosyltransferase involved in cell wall biosynthesis